MECVVITGADGFVGSHLVQHFAQEGLQVYALIIPDSPAIGRISNIRNVVVLQRNLMTTPVLSLAEKLPKSPAALIHLAWSGVSPESRNYAVNQIANINLCVQAVHLAAEIKAQRFILPGSTAEYAYCGQEINEETCPSPQNAYGAAKVAARYLCKALCEELQLPYIYTVITGIYAADRTDSNVIYYTISELLHRRKPSLTRLEQRWDYIHVDDVARALYLIATQGKEGAFYGIGHGDNWPLRNYICQIRDIIDPSLPLGIGEVPYQGTRLPSSCVDMTSLKRDTGFIPEIPFAVGITSVIERIKEQM